MGNCDLRHQPARNGGGAATARSPLNGAEIPLGAHPRNTGGKKGRSGRPPSAIRERCVGSFEERVSILEEIIDDPKSRAADRIRAMDLLGKYGLGALKEMQGDQYDRMEIVLVDEGPRGPP